MKLHPLKRKRVIWTRTTDAKLGTMPDSALARNLRITIGTVLKRRQKLGIAASRPLNSIRWTREMISMLGRIPDGRFAETYGMNILTVSTKRRDLGIRCFARKSKTWHYWTKKEIAMLGKMPDAVVAEKTGIKKPSVAWKRGKLGIPPLQPTAAEETAHRLDPQGNRSARQDDRCRRRRDPRSRAYRRPQETHLPRHSSLRPLRPWVRSRVPDLRETHGPGIQRNDGGFLDPARPDHGIRMFRCGDPGGSILKG